jgi:hypothetical protein
MTKEVIPGRNGQIVTANTHHFHAVFNRHVKIEYVLQGSAIKDCGVLFLKPVWQVLVHIMKMRGALIFRFVEGVDFFGTEACQEVLGVPIGLIEDRVYLAHVDLISKRLEYGLQVALAQAKGLSSDHSGPREVYVQPPAIQQESRAVNV